MSWPHFFPLAAVLLAIMCVCASLIVLMIRVGVMDVPGHRSSHARPIPKGGGIGIIAGFLLGVPVLYWVTGYAAPPVSLFLPLLGIALLAVFSWFDDVHSFRAVSKLGVQFVAATLVLIGSGWLTNAPWMWPFGLLWLLYVTNALNFIDGVNGLAAGSMALVAAAVSAGFMLTGNMGNSLAPLVLGVCLLTFLPFNFPKARIFMGDVGSQGAGLATAWFALDATRNFPAPCLVPLMLAPVLYDTGFTLIRRALDRQRLTEAHRGHLYQLAVRAGASPSRVTLFYWLLAVWGGIVAVLIRTPMLMGIAIAAPLAIWTLAVLRQARRSVSPPW